VVNGDQVKIWRIPPDGIVKDLDSERIVELSGHTKRLGHCEWHPTADNILLSVAYDLKVGLYTLSVAVKSPVHCFSS